MRACPCSVARLCGDAMCPGLPLRRGMRPPAAPRVLLGGLVLLGAALAGEASHARFVKVRFFWVRHAKSCGNVMYRCPAEPDQALLHEIEADLFRDIPLPGFESASLDKDFGIQGPSVHTKDCSVQILGTDRIPGKRGNNGAIVRMHDLIRDPPLADCSLRHAEHAGKTFLQWLKASGLPLHFVGSSFLMRAFETAVAMFLEPCFDGIVNCTGIIDSGLTVTQVPYVTERALPGRTSVSVDCIPREPERQSELMKDIYAREKDLHIDTAHAEHWPRDEQHFEKFKAFMATQIVPSLGQGMPWAAAPLGPFQRALEAEYEALEAPEVVLAIVGHSAMMKEYCFGGKGKTPANNAVLQKLFIMEATPGVAHGDVQRTDIVLRELQGNCSLVMDAIESRLALRDLLAEDVAACERIFPVVELLQLQAGGGGGGHTPCERLAESDDAFTIQPEFRPEGAPARA